MLSKLCSPIGTWERPFLFPNMESPRVSNFYQYNLFFLMCHNHVCEYTVTMISNNSWLCCLLFAQSFFKISSYRTSHDSLLLECINQKLFSFYFRTWTISVIAWSSCQGLHYFGTTLTSNFIIWFMKLSPCLLYQSDPNLVLWGFCELKISIWTNKPLINCNAFPHSINKQLDNVHTWRILSKRKHFWH